MRYSKKHEEFLMKTCSCVVQKFELLENLIYEKRLYVPFEGRFCSCGGGYEPELRGMFETSVFVGDL